MSIKKLSLVLLSAISLAALLNGCGSSSKDGAPGGTARVADEGVCIHCHSTSLSSTSGTSIIGDYATSSHNPVNSPDINPNEIGCEGCHGGGSQHNGVGPFPYANPLNSAVVDGVQYDTKCRSCHIPKYSINQSDLNVLFNAAKAGGFAKTCAPCHTDNGKGSVHGAHATPADAGCVDCHTVAAPQHGDSLVGDNNGVRAIVPEFQKWSHHIVNAGNADPRNEQCLACHAEGKVGPGGTVVVDSTFHMVDNKIYLRNGGGISSTQLAKELGGNHAVTVAGSNVSVFPWTPSAPDHNLMDQFCFSCHNANGAPNTVGIVAGNTATNPFNDGITNGYDTLARAKVVNVFSQFSSGNASHHAVRAKKYTGATRVAGATRAVTSPATFANNSSAPFTGLGNTYPNGKTGVPGAGPGHRQTIFDAGLFSTTYVPLGQVTANLGDDSTLHCGDCHTVGQWTNTNTAFNKAAIGAHGSANEYMLRNSKGSDELHNEEPTLLNATAITNLNDFAATTDMTTIASLVCYNCHKFSAYGAAGKHEGVNGGGDCNSDVRTWESAGQVGIANRLAVNGKEGNNIFGIQCASCHNSGPDARFGGIHGGNATYADGTGVVQKPYRFMPGLNNVKYAPNNHQRNDGSLKYAGQFGNISTTVKALITANKNVNTVELTTTWEEKTIYTGSRATCYTLDTTGGGPATGLVNSKGETVFGTWGGCSDHGGSATAGGHGGPRTIQRPLSY